jgi:hypothetical protein
MLVAGALAPLILVLADHYPIAPADIDSAQPASPVSPESSAPASSSQAQ